MWAHVTTPRPHALPGAVARPARPAPVSRVPEPRPPRRPAAALLRVAGFAAAAVLAAAPAPAQQASPPDRPTPAGAPPQPTAPPIEDPYALFENRLVREVRIEGLRKVPEQLVRNNIRTKAGQPLSAESIRADIRNLDRLGRFRRIDAQVQPYEDQSVGLIYRFVETPIIRDAEIIGNRQISNQRLAEAITLLPGTPVDQFQIDRARRAIENVYREKGYYLAEVTVDESELEETGTLLFRVLERDRVKVTDIRFEGNASFSAGQLRPNIRTKTASILETGPLDDEVLDQDVANLISYYRDRGFLDVRADRRITPSPDQREAIITFLIDEGPQYTLRSVRAELDDGTGRPSGRAPTVFSVEQLVGLMSIKAGDAYSVDKLNQSLRAIRNAYGRLGYAEARVQRYELRDPDSPQVDLLLVISEGARSKTGLVIIRGNDLTQQKVIRRHIRTRPDRPLDTTSLEESRRHIERLRLFEPGSVKLTIQPPDPSMPEHRDVLVEVEETNTGSLGFGVGIQSDLGLIGSISLSQRNFDIADVPDSFEELITGRAFRGAGQVFNLAVQPGTEYQNYSVSLTEPYFLETDNSLGGALFYREVEFREYDERRFGGTINLERRFGDRWNAALTTRIHRVDISNIDEDAPTDYFDFDEPAVLTGLGLRLTRSTLDDPFRPTRGARIELGAEQVGLLGGDFDYTRLNFEHALFLPIYENFLGRRTVLSFSTKIGYIPQDTDDVPVYERLYLGGQNFRGFRYRTISPKGIANNTGLPTDEPVGGTWSFLFSTELSQPLYEDVIRGVVFMDLGTVTDEPGFDDLRLSLGVGLRLSIPQFSQIPLAFDFGFPVLREETDRERVFSFTVDLPF